MYCSRHTILRVAVALALSPIAATSLAGPLNKLPPGRWYQFPDSRMDAVRPPGLSTSDVIGVMRAWSGGIYDEDRDRLVVWGGGHHDYSGNELYAFGPVNGNNPHWTRLGNPSSPPADNDLHALDGRPVSRHTYNLLTYLPAPRHQMMSCAVGARYSNGFGAAGVDFYDFDIDGFTGQPWSVGPTAPSNVYATSAFCIYNPATDRVWYHDHGSNNSRLQQYNPATGTWSTHALFIVENYAVPAIDWTRNLLVATGATFNGQNGKTLVWELDSPNSQPTVVTQTGPTDAAVGPAPGFVYDPLAKRFIGWNGGTALYQLAIPDNPRTGTWVWSAIAIDPGNTVVPTVIAHSDFDTGTYGRFRYVPSAHGVIVVNATDENVYFFKLPGTPLADQVFRDGFENAD